MNVPSCKRLRLVLGDQLNMGHPWFESVDDDTLYLVAELRQETDYVRHHVQKVLAFFAAMEKFAAELKDMGHQVLRLTLDDTEPFDDLPALLDHILGKSDAEVFEHQRPDEYRLFLQLSKFCDDLEIASRCCRSHHFLVPFDEIDNEFPTDRNQRMETFYRRMRKATGWLMDGEEPEGGEWNYDSENRKALPKDRSLPEPLVFENDVGDIRARLERHEVKIMGRLDAECLGWPVTRDQSLELLHHFVDELLPSFGDFQDAMTDRGWTLFHSRLSFSMNAKMLSPREVIEAVLKAWKGDQERYPLSAVEGFIRQIMGWREFMRGIYWTRMPDYGETNALGHERELPEFFWTGETKMACLKQAIGQSLDYAYAHHIQRLMLTGNFALLMGAHPDAVDAWYLGIYVDAIEWVEMPNTRGMSQFADGGVIASKPYVSSGNYINKMSDHCSGCHFDVKERQGESACPFNPLYWHFMTRHRERLESNPRIGMVYRNWDRMDQERKQAILETAEDVLGRLGEL